MLLVACYAPVLRRLARQWATDGDMGHGFFAAVVAGYIAWQRRDELLAAEAAPSWWGLAVRGWGALQLYFATVGAKLFLARTAFVISVAGMILLLGGFWRSRCFCCCSWCRFRLSFTTRRPRKPRRTSSRRSLHGCASTFRPEPAAPEQILADAAAEGAVKHPGEQGRYRNEAQQHGLGQEHFQCPQQDAQ